MRGMCTERIRALSQLGAEKIMFPSDICIGRVASLLKIINKLNYNF